MPENENLGIIADIFSNPTILYEDAVSRLEEAGFSIESEIRNDPDREEPDIHLSIQDSNGIEVLEVSVPVSEAADGNSMVEAIADKIEEIIPDNVDNGTEAGRFDHDNNAIDNGTDTRVSSENTAEREETQNNPVDDKKINEELKVIADIFSMPDIIYRTAEAGLEAFGMTLESEIIDRHYSDQPEDSIIFKIHDSDGNNVLEVNVPTTSTTDFSNVLKAVADEAKQVLSDRVDNEISNDEDTIMDSTENATDSVMIDQGSDATNPADNAFDAGSDAIKPGDDTLDVGSDALDPDSDELDHSNIDMSVPDIDVETNPSDVMSAIEDINMPTFDTGRSNYEIEPDSPVQSIINYSNEHGLSTEVNGNMLSVWDDRDKEGTISIYNIEALGGDGLDTAAFMHLSATAGVDMNVYAINDYSRILESISEPGISYDKAVENLVEAGISVEQRDSSLIFRDENRGGDHLCTVRLTVSDTDPVKAVVSELNDRISVREERVSMMENIRDIYAAWGKENGIPIDKYSFTADENSDHVDKAEDSPAPDNEGFEVLPAIFTDEETEEPSDNPYDIMAEDEEDFVNMENSLDVEGLSGMEDLSLAASITGDLNIGNTIEAFIQDKMDEVADNDKDDLEVSANDQYGDIENDWDGPVERTATD